MTATIVSTTTGKTTGFGAGSRVGRPAVTFAIRLSNGSAKIVDASQVVVGIRYGKTANVVGTPVYDDKTRDFSGDLAPKKATTARYTFEVPEPKSTEFVLTIDLDAAHEVATLRDRIK